MDVGCMDAELQREGGEGPLHILDCSIAAMSVFYWKREGERGKAQGRREFLFYFSLPLFIFSV